MTSRQYDLLLTSTQKFALWLPAIMFMVVPIFALFMFSSPLLNGVPLENWPAFPKIILPVFFLVLAGVYVRAALGLVRQISVTHEKQIIFRSALGSETVAASEMISIEPRSLQPQIGVSGYLLRHRNGYVRFPGQFTGMHVFLTELKQANPALEIRGC